MTATAQRVLLYTHGNANIVDGSIIWLTSMAEVLARAGAEVTLLLRANIVHDTMLQGVLANPRITVVEPFDAAEGTTTTTRLLTEFEVVERVVALDEQARFDLVICRALEPCTQLAKSGKFTGRLWLYPIDLPLPHVPVSAEQIAELDLLVAESDRVLAQTPQARAYLEYRLPQAVGKTLLITPMLPDDLAPLPTREPRTRLRASYSGKFAPGWRTLEMTQLPQQLVARGVELSITMVGDKIMHDPTDGTWRGRMGAALNNSPGVLWTGRVNRQHANALARGADIGLCWRDAALDSTHELSTKLLEYCALGVVPIVNRNAGHEDLLGADYPFFVTDSVDSVLAAIELAGTDPETFTRGREQALNAVASYRMSAAAARIKAELDRLAGAGADTSAAAEQPTAAQTAMVRRPLLSGASHRVGVDAGHLSPAQLDTALTAVSQRLSTDPHLTVSVRLAQYGPVPTGTGNLRAPRANQPKLDPQIAAVLAKFVAADSPLHGRVGIEFLDEALPNWLTRHALVLSSDPELGALAEVIGCQVVSEPAQLAA